jgi:hypothetical protein
MKVVVIQHGHYHLPLPWNRYVLEALHLLACSKN